MIYLKLFWCFFQVGLFSIGGGYAALPLIEAQVVNTYSWMTLEEFTDVIAIAGMMPGSVSVNAATFSGMYIENLGILGALVATFGCILPSCFIVVLIAMLYWRFSTLPVIKSIFKGLYPVVAALIASAGLRIIIMAFWGSNGVSVERISTYEVNINFFNIFSVILFALALFALKRFKLSPIYVMIGCAVLSGVFYLILK